MRSPVVLALVVALGALPDAGADGILDPTFGKGGLVTTDFTSAQDSVESLIVLPDGRAVAAGHTIPNLASQHMAVAQYLVSGALDPAFDGDGRVTVFFPAAHSGAEEVLLQPDGRLVLVGWAATDPAPNQFFGLARLNPNGSLDTSFGSGGFVLTPVEIGGGGTMAGLLQPDGRIVAIGRSGSAIAAARYNVDGSLDPAFGKGGMVEVPLLFGVEDAALQPDGKLVIAGSTGPFDVNRNFALFRLLPDGGIDTSFGGGDGLANIDFGQIENGQSVIVLGDGRLVVAGWRSPTTDNTGDIALVRYLADGSVDTTFGTGGFLRTDFNTSEDGCHAVSIAGPDLVLAAGSSPSGVFSDFALARYIATIPVELLTFSVE